MTAALVVEPERHQFLDAEPEEREHDARTEATHQIDDSSNADAVAEARPHPKQDRSNHQRATSGNTAADCARPTASLCRRNRHRNRTDRTARAAVRLKNAGRCAEHIGPAISGGRGD